MNAGTSQLCSAKNSTAPHYRWLNDRVCAVEGEVRPRTDGSGFEVVFEVSEMVWEGVA